MKKFEDIKTDVSVWWYGVRWNAKRKFDDSVEWVGKYKEELIIASPFLLFGMKMAGGLVKDTIRSIDRKVDMKKEQDLQELYVYDHSLGMYHKLRRPLRPSEKIEIDRRRKDGESKIQILASMGLLD